MPEMGPALPRRLQARPRRVSASVEPHSCQSVHFRRRRWALVGSKHATRVLRRPWRVLLSVVDAPPQGQAVPRLPEEELSASVLAAGLSRAGRMNYVTMTRHSGYL